MERKINPRLNLFNKYKVMGNIINPWNFGLPMFNPLIAPLNFDPTAQNVNIYQKFISYSNLDRAYAYTFSDTYNTLTLAAITNVTYRYGYTRGGIDYVFDVTSVTNPFTATIDTKRWVIVNYTLFNFTATLPVGAVWAYIGNKCNQMGSQNNIYLTYIHLQDNLSLSSFSSNGFSGCTNLTGKLTIPSTINTINQFAFQNCAKLSGDLILPNTINVVGYYAFQGCSGLTGNLTISTSISNIPVAFFDGCKFTGTLVIPSNITIIDVGAFKGCRFTGSLNIPSTVTTVSNYAFAQNTGFTGTLVLPNTVTTWGSDLNLGIFEGCTGFTGTVTIPPNMTVIPYNLINGCIGITNVVFHNAVTIIRTNAFKGCVGLTSLNLPSSLIEIGGTAGYGGAFLGCTGLTGNLTIPNSVTTIGYQAFGGCNNMLGTLTLPNSLTSWAGTSFYPDRFTGALVIPSGITTYPDNSNTASFSLCTFTSLDLPAGLTYITTKGFSSSPLTVIYSRATIPPTLNQTYGVVFTSGTKTNCILHVPVGRKSAYLAATEWSAFTPANVIEDL